MKSALFILLIACFFVAFQLPAACLPVGRADSYDGLWFMGFNMKKEVFSGPKGKLVRQAFNHAINRSYICREIIGDSNVPSGVMPLGLPGHTDIGYSYAPGQAKKLLASSGLRKGDNRLKGLVLIHTDGQKTVKIVQAIKKELSAVGIDVSLKQIDYEEDDTWEKELTGGTAALFLMGYKVPPQPFEKNDPVSRSEKFLYELFHSKGEANMFFLRDSNLDALIETTETVPSKEAELKNKLLSKADRILFDNPVTVNLFYIKELQ